MARAVKSTEREMVELLRQRYCQDSGNGPAAVLFPQVRNAAGFDATRTADALVMQLWPSRGLHLEGFEVKCSRADVLKELKQPEKAEAIARFCEKWWLVLSDPAFIKDGELPEEWGLLVLRGSKLHAVKPAPLRKVPRELPKTFLAALLRQADREAHRPTEEAIAAARAEGIEIGKREAGYAGRNLERLQGEVAEFEEATGIKITGYAAIGLTEAKALVKLLTGDDGQGPKRWGSLVSRLSRFGSDVEKLRADLVAAGLVED